MGAITRFLRIEEQSFPNTIKNRFYSKMMLPKTEDGCMEWLGAKNFDKYGSFNINGTKSILAHRYCYILFFGEIPEGKLVCHKCDNPSCVRPDHLFLGSIYENIIDRNNKNRTAKGTFRPNSKLTDDYVRDIKNLLKTSMKISDIAKKYGVSPQTIHAININKTWKHIKGDI